MANEQFKTGLFHNKELEAISDRESERQGVLAELLGRISARRFDEMPDARETMRERMRQAFEVTK